MATKTIADKPAQKIRAPKEVEPDRHPASRARRRVLESEEDGAAIRPLPLEAAVRNDCFSIVPMIVNTTRIHSGRHYALAETER